MKKELLIALNKFRTQNPEWNQGELALLDFEKEARRRYRLGDKKLHSVCYPISQINCDKENDHGDPVPFEPRDDDGFWDGETEPLPRFWSKAFDKLNGKQAIIVFLVFQWQWTQQQVADYLNLAKSTVNEHYSLAIKSLQTNKSFQRFIGIKRGN